MSVTQQYNLSLKKHQQLSLYIDVNKEIEKKFCLAMHSSCKYVVMQQLSIRKQLHAIST